MRRRESTRKTVRVSYPAWSPSRPSWSSGDIAQSTALSMVLGRRWWAHRAFQPLRIPGNLCSHQTSALSLRDRLEIVVFYAGPKLSSGLTNDGSFDGNFVEAAIIPRSQPNSAVQHRRASRRLHCQLYCPVTQCCSVPLSVSTHHFSNPQLKEYPESIDHLQPS